MNQREMQKSNNSFALLLACLVENMEVSAQANKFADDLEGFKNKTKLILHEPIGIKSVQSASAVSLGTTKNNYLINRI
jgi:hypothetical protein